MTEPLTPSQTVGPFLHIALLWADGPEVVPDGAPGSFVLSGAVRDGAGESVPDALVETWQADPHGGFQHPDDPRAGGDGGFRGFGRCATDQDGRFWVRTVKPGSLPTVDGDIEAPHLDVSVFARGLLDRVVTRCYFADEPAANEADPVLRRVEPARRGTLLAEPVDGGYRWDIRLQGAGETVFFEV
jgi:protocatechuate 3,4-dioxygenase alpha subunit